MDKDTLRSNLLLPFLNHAAFDGWNDKALEQAALEIGEPQAAGLLAFPAGAADVWCYYLETITDQMESGLAGTSLEELKIRERIALMVRTHLTLQAEYQEALRHASVLYMSPVKPVIAGSSLWKMVDRMWYLAGDRATDYNHYSKRTLLMGVYVSTFYAWLQDQSEDFKESWDYLDRRIENVMQFGRMTRKIKSLPFVRLLFKERLL